MKRARERVWSSLAPYFSAFFLRLGSSRELGGPIAYSRVLLIDMASLLLRRGVFGSRNRLGAWSEGVRSLTTTELSEYKGRIYDTDSFCTIDVRWGDQDAMNHVNNAKYFTYIEQARCEWWERSKVIPGLSASTVFDVAPILASTECKFKKPVEFPDRLTVGISVELLDKARGDLRHHYFIHSTAQGTVVAEATADIVAYAYKDKKRCAVPDEWVVSP